jgi:hypothetical protein
VTRLRAAALVIVVAAALLPAVGVFVDLAAHPQWLDAHDDSISAFERRYAPLRAALHDATAVGYVAPPSQDAATRTAYLYTARYTLAPVQVFEGMDQSLVIADGMPATSRIPPDFSVRHDYGNGLLLLERGAVTP